jgi:hypothetical protein
MQNTIVHYEGATSLEAVATKVKPSSTRIKIDLDVHARQYVAVAQYALDWTAPSSAFRDGISHIALQNSLFGSADRSISR